MNIGGGRKIFGGGGGVACPRRHLFALPLWCPEGREPPAALAVPAAAVPEGRRAPGGTGSPCRCGARRGSEPPAALARPAAVVPGGAASPRRHWLSLPLACLLAPYPPNPLPRRGRGRLLVYFAGGYRPRHPGIKPPTALTEPPKQMPCAEGNPRFATKGTETLSYEQCRQPRRGGSGGEELRRLRWSSPPGQSQN